MRRPLLFLTSTALGLALMPPVAFASPSAPALTAPAATPAERPATSVRAATFNVRTARAPQDKRTWLQRAPDVAREILSRNPGIVMMQELGPGRADGRKGAINGAPRQTTSLTSTLSRLGGGRYRLVRSTAYARPGAVHGTLGSRILYDSSRYRLLSSCPETTGRLNYNPACGFDLPLAAGDGPARRRSAAFAKFQDRRTGHQFWVASAHLDERHSKSGATEAKYNRLRAAQAATVADTVARRNRNYLPVIFGGDLNSWQTDRGRYAPYRALVARGYGNAVNAPTRTNWAYPTVNHFKTWVKRSKSRYGGVRLDVVMVRGSRGFTRYENKMVNPDSTRPSDHNVVVADFRI
ncbi:MAG: endonuclease/exonuclease/phosphatase family protein [Actinomycetes bacterium]